MLVFAWLNLAGLTNIDITSSLGRARILMLMIVLVLVALALLLIGSGWSVALARLGGIWSFAIVFTAITIAMATGAGGLRQPLTAELWSTDPRPGRLDILLKVANQISDLNRGTQAALPITFLNENSQSLLWLFRDWQINRVDYLAPDSTPEIIITHQSDISLTVNYRGESLVLNETIEWAQASSSDWLRWFIYRQMPLEKDDVILWLRNDLMLENQETGSTSN
jgi:hypothetical protein